MESATSIIVQNVITLNNFELKLNFTSMVQQMCQFDGFQDEDLYMHMTNFLEICDTFKQNGVPEDVIHL